MQYSIRQVSERTRLEPHVLRYYEKEGLLPFVKRSAGGIRCYSEEDIEWLDLICCLKNTGMPIKMIRQFVDLTLQGEQTMQARCDMLCEHRAQVEKQLESLQGHLKKVNCKIELYSNKLGCNPGRK